MKRLVVELGRLSHLVLTLLGTEEVGCVSDSGGATVNDKMGGSNERNARENSPQPGRRLRGGKVTGWKETARKETGTEDTERKDKEMGAKATREKENEIVTRR